MAYSHSRLRKTLALVRIATGLAFVSLGWFKVGSLDFGKLAFPDFLDTALRGGAAAIMHPLLQWFLDIGPARVGVTLGFMELFIGVALVLGLAVRPACAIGMVYMAMVWLATWNPASVTAFTLQTADLQFRNLFALLLLLVLAVGHAGETWGVGALYHRHRQWAAEQARLQAAPTMRSEHEPSSFEEVAEAEARARELAASLQDETEHVSAGTEL